MAIHLNRRVVLASAAASLLPLRAVAQDWKAQFKELRLGVSSAENEAGALARWEPVAKYLTEVLGVPVRTYRVADYAGLVEGMRGDQIEFSRFGPAVYSMGRRVMGDKLKPLFRDIDNNGAEGYYSIVVVKAESPYQTLADLKGKPFLFADPNSTSGYAFPQYYMRKQGFDPAAHFSATAFSGSHENSVIGVVRGQYDAAATYWTNEESGMVQRLESRGMIPKGAVRIIWKSPLIPASPFCARANLPQALQDAVKEAFFTMKERAPDVWKALTDGKVKGYAPAKHEDYLDVVAVLDELDRERKKRGS
ncbi:phosphonate ABC transporter substrate-binding protein [Rhabdaerophilum calidifontis]|uniref:phosphonate ABC transporter substrate-binding protein n=1 Tax=Rhabdaerophilum calidifontis TaxID=2604328 RepID=UPI00140C5F2C|nr:phosphonate ABC transporter substrate-binding protein [Rhabdaerophilum calidifontis]